MRATAILLLALAGCVHDARDEVVRVFAVAEADGPTDTTEDPVVALGSTVRLRFAILERLGDGSLSQATYHPTDVDNATPSVIEVVEAYVTGGYEVDRHVVVRGVRAGEGRLIVHSGDRQHAVRVRVGVPAAATIEDPLERAGESVDRLVYLAGANARLELGLRAAGGGVVRGDPALGETAVRVRGPASIVERTDTHVTLHLDAPGTVELDVLGTRRRLAVVSPQSVHVVQVALRATSFGGGCLWRPFDLDSTPAGRDRQRHETDLILVSARTTDGRVIAGVDGLLEIASDTPDHCTLAPAARPDYVVHVLRFYHPLSSGYQVQAFDLLTGPPGECVITASLAGASTRRRIAVR